MSSRRLPTGYPECDRGAALGAPLAGGVVNVPGPRSWLLVSGFTARTAPPIRRLSERVGGSRHSVQGVPPPPRRQCKLLMEEVSRPARGGGVVLSPELEASCF